MENPKPSVIMMAMPPRPVLNKDPYFKTLKCSMPGCNTVCRNYIKYEEHLDSCHHCSDCSLYAADITHHHCHRKGQRGGHVDSGGGLIDLDVFKEERRVHKGVGKSYWVYFKNDFIDVDMAFESIRKACIKLLKQLLKVHGSIVVDFCFVMFMERDDVIDDGVNTILSETMYFRSKIHKLLSEEQIDDLIVMCLDEIKYLRDKYTEVSSQWRIVRIDAFEVKVGEFRLLHTNRPEGYLELPFKKRKRYGVRNLKNGDGRCFEYTMAMALFFEEERLKNIERRKVGKGVDPLNYKTWTPYLTRLNFSGMEDGVDVHNNLKLFESNNDVQVSVITHEGETVFPLRLSTHSRTADTRVVHLFLIQGEKDQSGFRQTHFAWIYDLNKFNSVLNPKRKSFYCDTCLTRFPTEKRLQEHVKLCNKSEEEIEYTLPPEGETIKFKKHQMTLETPFCCFFDFEASMTPVSGKKSASSSKTKYNAEFHPVSFSLVVVKTLDGKLELVEDGIEYHQGENIMEKFFERVLWWSEKLLHHLRSTNRAVITTPEQMAIHNSKTHCDFCKGEFVNTESELCEDDFDLIDEELEIEDIERMITQSRQTKGSIDVTSNDKNPKKKKLYKTIHHHHMSGLMAPHTICHICNLGIVYSNEIVFYCHNLTNYDGHLIIKALDSNLIDADRVKCVAKNSEKLISIVIEAKDKYVPPPFDLPQNMAKYDRWLCGARKVRARFSDTMNYMKSSLSALTDNLRAENHPFFSLVSESYPYLFRGSRTPKTGELSLLLQKVPFCYSFITGVDKLAEGTPFPGPEYFYDDLRDEPITTQDWELVNKIKNTFGIDDFPTYLRLYNCLDSILLAIVFTAFKDQCYKYYGLCVCYSNTAASYAWQAFLFMSQTSISFMRDKSQVDMISDGIRGGISGSVGKIHKSNCETAKNYDPTTPPSVIASFDLVSLYSYCMENYPFPISDYEWVDVDSFDLTGWHNLDLVNSDYGYVFQVSLSYPESLHDFTSDIPLAPVKTRILYDILSPGQQEAVTRMGNKGKQILTMPKLLTTCDDKDYYVCHGIELQFYLSMGLRVKKYHKIMRFKQDFYFKKYISVNTARRQQTTVESQRSILKLLSNVIFGRSLQSNKSFLEVKFCSSKASARKMLADPRLKSWKILSENLSMYMMRPKKVCLNNPQWAGMSVLCISKTIFYDMVYRKLKYIWRDNLQCLQFDTDGICVKIENTTSEKFFRDLVNFQDWFDFSKLSRECLCFKMHPEYPDLPRKNASVSGKIKIESVNILEVVSLVKKTYSILHGDSHQEKKHKGTDNRAGRVLTHELYKKVASTPDMIVNVNCKRIQSVDHQLYKVTAEKVGLSNLDLCRVYYDKNDMNKSLPFGHFRLKEIFAASTSDNDLQAVTNGVESQSVESEECIEVITID